MLAAISDAKGRMLALHRTYLAPDGSAKAPVQPPKMTLGQVAGLACHLGIPSTEIAVAEGIDTALSVQLATGIPTWAAISAGGFSHLGRRDASLYDSSCRPSLHKPSSP
jgi:phage/plasmid primase-like uncharacterized protein